MTGRSLARGFVCILAMVAGVGDLSAQDLGVFGNLLGMMLNQGQVEAARQAWVTLPSNDRYCFQRGCLIAVTIFRLSFRPG